MTQTVYIKVTIPALAPLDVSIYSSILSYRTPAGMVKRLQALADKQGIKASYELSTYEEYWEHRTRVRAEINRVHRANRPD